MSDRSEYVKVYDTKSKQERIVTKVAYKILAGRRYDLLEGDVEPPEVQKKSGAEHVEGKISTGNLMALDAPFSNETVGDEVIPITETQGIKVLRRKPGPKPKNNA